MHVANTIAHRFTMPEKSVLKLIDQAATDPALWRLAEYVVGTRTVQADRKVKNVAKIEQVAEAA